MLLIYQKGAELIELGVPVQQLSSRPVLARARRCKSLYRNDEVEKLQAFSEEVLQDFHQIRLEYAKFQEHER
jgi:V/A-type H+-transporting ATPase subunit A